MHESSVTHKHRQKKTEGIGAALDLCGQCPIASAARAWGDLARRSCYSGVHSAVTKHDKPHWHGRKQENIGTVAPLLASAIAAGGFQTHCRGCGAVSS